MYLLWIQSNSNIHNVSFISMRNHNYFLNSALPVGPYVELEMIRDMIPQIEPLPIAIPIAAPIAIPSKYHKNFFKSL